MKRPFLIIAGLFLFMTSFGQRLAQVTLTNSGNGDIISFIIDDNVLVNMTKDGQIIDWGVENITGRPNYYPQRLEKYMGRIEYYSPNDNEDSRGKVKYIGRTAFSYYSSYENELFKGKVKTIGTTTFDYYNSYDDKDLQGKLKSAGSVSLAYYTSFDNEAYKGKLKNIGATTLTYYASYDDNAYKGKLKSIDGETFTYYSSFDKREYRGGFKTGYKAFYIINGVKYFIK